MKKRNITLLTAIAAAAALAPAAQAVTIAHTGFEEPASGVSSFTPSGSDTEIGFSVPDGGNFSVSTAGVITGTKSFRMKTSVGLQQNDGYSDPLTDLGTSVTFGTVDLSGFSGVDFSVDINVIISGYEHTGGDGGEAYRVFLDLFDGTSTTTVTVFDSWVSIGDLDGVDDGPTLPYTYDVPDNTVSATASVFWNSTSASEGMDIDNLSFIGTAIPEPTSMSLLALSGLVMLRRRRA